MSFHGPFFLIKDEEVRHNGGKSKNTRVSVAGVSLAWSSSWKPAVLITV